MDNNKMIDLLLGVHGSKKRFHFRRAHKRNLTDGREIRIGWMFVGDIELGFVDKDYEL